MIAAWLIQRTGRGGLRSFYTLDPASRPWTLQPEKALRFARWIDSEMFIAGFLSRRHVSVPYLPQVSA